MILEDKIQMDTIVVQKIEIDAVDMDGEKVMMNLDKGKYYGLNSIGSHIWEIIKSPLSVESVILKLLAEYDIDEKTCKESVMTFLERMYKEGLICISR
jgi:hypothetical protein